MNKKEELKTRIEGVDASIEYFKKAKSELETELEELEQQESQEWEPNFGETYFYIDLDAMITQTSTWLAATNDTIRLEHKVIFKTEAESEEYLEYLKAKEKAKNEFSKEEWENDNIEKHCIQCNYIGKNLTVNHKRYCKDINSMYFRTKELAQEFVNKYEKFLRRELGV